ncbi:hypothetical protein WS67_22635 [Burkholderia singularis]|uniref:Uncharacterized protein n=1 Tax=Burkholderia singularis TaxID=1503053 RepID=A0A103DVH7_9BURK|nr:hypothetical protein WS67_22635 [Burkholderia singularis]
MIRHGAVRAVKPRAAAARGAWRVVGGGRRKAAGGRLPWPPFQSRIAGRLCARPGRKSAARQKGRCGIYRSGLLP